MVVVGPQPLVGHELDVSHGLEDVNVEQFLAIGTVEALDEGVLIGLAGLDVAELDRLLLAPFGEDLRGQLRSAWGRR